MSRVGAERVPPPLVVCRSARMEGRTDTWSPPVPRPPLSDTGPLFTGREHGETLVKREHYHFLSQYLCIRRPDIRRRDEHRADCEAPCTGTKQSSSADCSCQSDRLEVY